MATTGVMRPGHVQIRVLDMDESVHFYKDVLGLVETGRDAQGRVYFKAWDEFDHHSVILRQADQAGMDFMGFKVRDAATLAKLAADLQAYGVAIERLPAGDSGALYDELQRRQLSLEALEDTLINEAVDRAAGNLSAAARALGLTRPQLSYRLQRLRERARR